MKTTPKGSCPTCGRKNRRSNQANARYWLLMHLLSEKMLQGKYPPDSWHTFMKSRFLGCDDVQIPNGKVLVIPKSSAVLDTAEFAEYMEHVEVWANEHGVWFDEIENAA
jgi:hypothetical protein